MSSTVTFVTEHINCGFSPQRRQGFEKSAKDLTMDIPLRPLRLPFRLSGEKKGSEDFRFSGFRVAEQVKSQTREILRSEKRDSEKRGRKTYDPSLNSPDSAGLGDLDWWKSCLVSPFNISLLNIAHA